MLWIVPVFLDGPSDSDQTISESVELPGVADMPKERQTIDLEQPMPTETAPPAEQATGESASDNPSAAAATTEPSTTDAAPPSTEQAPPPVARADTAPPQRAEASRDEPPAVEPASATDVPDSPPAASGEGLWAVQLGSFSAKDNASRLAAELRASDIPAFLTEIRRDGSVLHRVRVGPVADRAAAEKLAAELAAKGHKGRVVPHP